MNRQEPKHGADAVTEPTMTPNSIQGGGSPKIVHWGNEPRKLQNGLSRPHEIFLNVISILLAGLLFVYIAFLAVFDGAIVEHAEQQSSFLREMSQLVSPNTNFSCIVKLTLGSGSYIHPDLVCIRRGPGDQEFRALAASSRREDRVPRPLLRIDHTDGYYNDHPGATEIWHSRSHVGHRMGTFAPWRSGNVTSGVIRSRW